MARGMDMGSSFIRMGGIMKASGNVIRWMAGGSFSMRAGNWRMKVTGVKISFMGLGKSIMTIR
jgi:hypothetical protein